MKFNKNTNFSANLANLVMKFKPNFAANLNTKNLQQKRREFTAKTP